MAWQGTTLRAGACLGCLLLPRVKVLVPKAPALSVMSFASAILPVSGSLRSSQDLTLSIRKPLGHSFVQAPLHTPLIHPPYQNCLSPRKTAFNKLIFYYVCSYAEGPIDVYHHCCRTDYCHLLRTQVTQHCQSICMKSASNIITGCFVSQIRPSTPRPPSKNGRLR
jgi:hypothetical protein